MADRVIQRNDTAANWQKYNPILAQGEIGIEIDGAKGYKIGDGKTRWNALEYPSNPASVVQDGGDSETAVMSQKAVTKHFEAIKASVVDISQAEFDAMMEAGTLDAEKTYFIYE